MLNNTNETATIFYTGEYGEVHEWFSRDNPTTVIDEAHIGVRYTNQYITYNVI